MPFDADNPSDNTTLNDMNTTQYFKQARLSGAFTAKDCLRLARQAVAIDDAAKLRNISQPVVVWHEVMPDGSGMARFSHGITVY